MNLIEIRYPAGGLDDDDRAAFAADIVDGFVGERTEDEVPQETLRRARKMTHIGFLELDGWTIGEGPWRLGTTPPLWITMTVPELWRAEMARYAIGWLRHSVRRLDQRRAWERSVGSVWINVTGIADGSIGLDGTPASADDVVSVMSEEFRARADKGDDDLPDGVVIDPMCGMTVKLGKGAITLEHQGVTMGFCAYNCRDAYARREKIPIPD